MPGKGRGWHGESGRHRQAAFKGRDSLVEWPAPISKRTLRSVKGIIEALDADGFDFAVWAVKEAQWKAESNKEFARELRHAGQFIEESFVELEGELNWSEEKFDNVMKHVDRISDLANDVEYR